MQITHEYLDALAVEVTTPREFALHDWEMPPTATIGLDDPDGHSLAVNHWDEWPSPQGWRNEGPDQRWTLVVLHKDNKSVGGVGYEFAGLVKLDNLRAWFRAKLGVVEAPATNEEVAA